MVPKHITTDIIPAIKLTNRALRQSVIVQRINEWVGRSTSVYGLRAVFASTHRGDTAVASDNWKSDVEKRSGDDRRAARERRSGVDTRSEKEKRTIGERRANADRRTGKDRRAPPGSRA